MSEDPSNPVALHRSHTGLTSQSTDFDAKAYRRDRATTIARTYRALSLAITIARPASYTDAACKAWLEAAFEFVADLPVEVLELAALEAGNVCRHPAQIVPTIREKATAIIAARDRQRRLAAPLRAIEGWPDSPRTWWRPSPEELEAAKQEMKASTEGAWSG